MGQNIGTCVTALIASIGANKNARRAALVHLYFNIIGSIVFVSLFVVSNALFDIAFFGWKTNYILIALAHSAFNLSCTALLLPFSGFLEKLAHKSIPDDDKQDKILLLDVRLFSTPSIALNRSRDVAKEMAFITMEAIRQSFSLVSEYDEKAAQKVRDAEQQTDAYEDALGTYLVKLSNQNLTTKDNIEASKLLFLIGEFERISDYAMEITESANEMNDKKIQFSGSARKSMKVMLSAVEEAVEMAVDSFCNNDIILAAKVDPLEEVIDDLKSLMKKQHIGRLQCNECTIEMGFIFSDMISGLERISDHCSNIAGCVIEMSHDSFNMHKYLYKVKHEPNNEFIQFYKEYSSKYAIT